MGLFSCESYPVVDFQAERCKQPPMGSIKATDQGNKRWELSLEGVSSTIETEPFRILWTIEGQSFAAQRVSYQFEKRGEQKITLVMTNRCFMQTTKEVMVNVN